MRVKKRKDGRYPVSISVNGKRKWFYGSTQQEANIKANKWMEQYGSRDITNLQTLTVKGYLERWLELHAKSKEVLTIAGYRNYIDNHIIPAIGSYLMDKLRPMHIKEYYADELTKFSPKTVLQEHRILKKAFRDAVNDDIILKNPCDAVKAPSVFREYEPVIYTDEEFMLLMNAVTGTPDEIPIILAGLCGLRRSEVFGLKWSDVNLKTGILTVARAAISHKGTILYKTPKNKSSFRTLAMPEEVITVLKKYQGIGFVCCNVKGKSINPSTYSHNFADLLKRHGLKHIRFHDLRHYNATLMLRLGISDKEAASRLGHANLITLKKTYQHILEEMDAATASKINSHYKNGNVVKTVVKTENVILSMASNGAGDRV